MRRIETDILIAGGGVAGLTAAAVFGNAGLRVIIIDPAPPVTQSEAAGADLRTTAFLQPARVALAGCGLWDRLASHATPLQTMRIIDAASVPPEVRDFEAHDISELPFGWNLPNWLLRREMVAHLDGMDNVTFLPGVGFDGMVARMDAALVRLSDGQQIAAQLVIGADGRQSAVRQAAGIDVTTTRYGQKAIVFAVTHATPHNNVSTEVHAHGGPFTLVPLPDRDGRPCSAVVWMTDGADAQRLVALAPAAFADAATTRSAEHYGPLTLASPRTVWPIITQVAQSLTANRTALIAEAAHVVPPIGAQGLNMSLADIAALDDLAQKHRDALGGTVMLDAYQRARHGDIKARAMGIDALNRASMAGGPVLSALRRKGLAALHGLTPVRHRLMALGLGMSPDR